MSYIILMKTNRKENDMTKEVSVAEILNMTYEDGVTAAKAEIIDFGVDLELVKEYQENPEHFLDAIPDTIQGQFPEFTRGYMEHMTLASKMLDIVKKVKGL